MPLRHPQLRILRPKHHQIVHHLLAVGLRQALGRHLAHLRGVQADPQLRDVRVRRPELHELFEVSVAAHLLPRHGAVDGDVVPLDVLQDAVVGGGLAALVVLGLQPVDRHDDLQPPQPAHSSGIGRTALVTSCV